MGRGWRNGWGLSRDRVQVAPTGSPVTPLFVVLLVYGGLADGPAESVGASSILGVLATSWVVIGLSVRLGNLAVSREAGA